MDRDFQKAFAKSQAAAGSQIPAPGSTVFISVADRDKRSIVLPALRLHQLGYKLLATKGTQVVLARNGIVSETVKKHSEIETGETIIDLINSRRVDMIVNTPSGGSSRADGYEIRAAAIVADVPIFTTVSALSAAVGALSSEELVFDVKSLQDYALERR